ncbi:MAG: dephospho-CoA kinase, partial [Chitinivibrionales bacterium]
MNENGSGINIGVSGYAGSGKTLFCMQLSSVSGLRVLDADAEAFSFICSRPDVAARISEAFGTAPSEDETSRRELSKKVFRSIESLVRYNNIVQPYVREFIVQRLRGEGSGVILDAALIPYWGIREEFDTLIWIDADRTERVDRIASKSGLSYKGALERAGMQESLFS